MDHPVEKFLYSRRDAAVALSLSVRSVDYLITTGRLPMRRIGGRILIPANAVRRFAREDHPDLVRSSGRRQPNNIAGGRHTANVSAGRFEPQNETLRAFDIIRGERRC
jgi:hypothetical protein